MEYLDTVILNNSLMHWLIALGTMIVSYIVLKIVIGFIRKRLEKISLKKIAQVSDLIVIVLKKTTSLSLLFIAVFIASVLLTMNDSVRSKLVIILVIVLLIQVAVWGNALITFYIGRYIEQRKTTDAAAVTTVSALGFISKLILYTALFIMALDKLGFDITTLVAGLGVGGIAIALAVQNILGDLFASLSIVLDKPFVIGDFIIVNEYLGTVEHIGLKTTRLRSLSGEQLVFSNTDLLSSRIRNYKRMNERRIVFTIGVVYQTAKDQLEKIPGYIREIIEKHEQVRFDRAHFKGYGNFSLDFEMVYWVKSPDYNIYMDVQQSINLQIYEKFTGEKIEFAYPTQTLFVEKNQS